MRLFPCSRYLSNNVKFHYFSGLACLSLAALAGLAGCAGANGTAARDQPAPAGSADRWVDAWGASFLPTTINGNLSAGVPTFDNQTVRFNIYAEVGGTRARVKFTNKFGSELLTIGEARLALRDHDSAIMPGTDRALTFAGAPGVTLPPGAEIWSDPADLAIPQHSDVAISVFIPGKIKPTGFHPTGLKTMYLSAPGNFVSAPTLPRATSNPATITSLFFLSDLQVLASARTIVVVGFGDSITDGANSNVDTNTSWPALLSQRLPAKADGTPVSVINMGIGSNRIVSADAAGPAGVKRFDDDVLARPNVKYVIVLEGINDISYESASADQLIAAYRQLIAQAHAHGLKIYGATLLPILNSRKYTVPNEATRAAVNQWLRTAHEFDAVIDFEAAVRDPANPLSIRADLTRDYVHPNSAGYKLMAEAIPVELIQ